MTSLLIKLFAISITISVHQFGHAYTAYKLGDKTAKRRMTLNPLEHIDPIGMIMMITVGVGWTKPSQVSSLNFKQKTMKRDLVLVNLSGAAFNALTALFCAILMKFIPIMSAQIILSTVIGYNLSFAAFNMLPIPNLDGWNIIKQFIPYKHYESVYQYEDMSMFIFLFMILTNAHMIIMGPIYNILSTVIYGISNIF